MNQTTFNFKNKVALVTGGAAGIGKEIALHLAKSHATLVISDVNEDDGEQTVQIIREQGEKAIFLKCDVSKEDEIIQLISETEKNFGALHLVCNNAGVEGEQAQIHESSVANWDKVIETNLKGVWLSMKHEIPLMLKSGGGSIVNMASIAGLVGFPSLSPYVASKHGVVGLTKTAALEYAKQNIRVNAICPGPILTDMLQRLMDSTPGFAESIKSGVPMGEIGNVQEVAQTVEYLLSDSASYITGQALAVDGGWIAQ